MSFYGLYFRLSGRRLVFPILMCHKTRSIFTVKELWPPCHVHASTQKTKTNKSNKIKSLIKYPFYNLKERTRKGSPYVKSCRGEPLLSPLAMKLFTY
ncbi:hypothetical protein BGS_1017 [Beggiatoa sp. SS]|nr:hypothetical protein BGS_1017 [Beggiatoa sp. SS]